MKTPSKSCSGFTLMELMVAMAITSIIVTVLVSITSIAIDTWNRSRAELRASRQAKAMVDTMARDFEALVTRRGNEFEWLSAMVAPSNLPGGSLKSTNAAELVFFAGSTDRYDGEIGGTNDKGGDVSCVAYRLRYRDPIGTGGGDKKYETFVLNRLLVNPDATFNEILGKKDLNEAFGTARWNSLDQPENFVCENVYQFTITFHVEITEDGGTVRTESITVGPSGNSVTSFKIKGTGIEVTGGSGSITADQLKAGRLKAMEIALTVISDAGIDQLRNRGFAGDQQAEFLAKNSYQYTKLIQLPTM